MLFIYHSFLFCFRFRSVHNNFQTNFDGSESEFIIKTTISQHIENVLNRNSWQIKCLLYLLFSHHSYGCFGNILAILADSPHNKRFLKFPNVEVHI